MMFLLLLSYSLWASHALCPDEQPNTGDACVSSDWDIIDGISTCYWGEETCCEQTYPSYGCHCDNDQAACFYTDACFVPYCDTPEPTGLIFCTEDAKLCPDGSFVSRAPPDCEFEDCEKGKRPQKICGGILGIQCDEGYDCLDDPRDDCEPVKGGADCGGICMKSKKEKKEKKPKKEKAEEGDSCDLCIRPLCACGLCPDKLTTYGCCGECVYKETDDGLKCLYEGTLGTTSSEACVEVAAKSVDQPVIGVESIVDQYVGMEQKHFVWFYGIVGLLVVIGCIMCYCFVKKCKGTKYKYVDDDDCGDSEAAKLNV